MRFAAGLCLIAACVKHAAREACKVGAPLLQNIADAAAVFAAQSARCSNATLVRQIRKRALTPAKCCLIMNKSKHTHWDPISRGVYREDFPVYTPCQYPAAVPIGGHFKTHVTSQRHSTNPEPLQKTPRCPILALLCCHLDITTGLWSKLAAQPFNLALRSRCRLLDVSALHDKQLIKRITLNS